MSSVASSSAATVEEEYRRLFNVAGNGCLGVLAECMRLMADGSENNAASKQRLLAAAALAESPTDQKLRAFRTNYPQPSQVQAEQAVNDERRNLHELRTFCEQSVSVTKTADFLRNTAAQGQRPIAQFGRNERGEDDQYIGQVQVRVGSGLLAPNVYNPLTAGNINYWPIKADPHYPLSLPGGQSDPQDRRCSHPNCGVNIPGGKSADFRLCEIHAPQLTDKLRIMEVKLRSTLISDTQPGGGGGSTPARDGQPNSTETTLYGQGLFDLNKAFIEVRLARSQLYGNNPAAHEALGHLLSYFELMTTNVAVYRLFMNPWWQTICAVLLALIAFIVQNQALILQALQVGAQMVPLIQQLIASIGVNMLNTFMVAVWGFFSMVVVGAVQQIAVLLPLLQSIAVAVVQVALFIVVTAVVVGVLIVVLAALYKLIVKFLIALGLWSSLPPNINIVAVPGEAGIVIKP